MNRKTMVERLYICMTAFFGTNKNVYEMYLVDMNGLILAGIGAPEWYRIGDMIAAFLVWRNSWRQPWAMAA